MKLLKGIRAVGQLTDSISIGLSPIDHITFFHQGQLYSQYSGYGYPAASVSYVTSATENLSTMIA